MSTTLRYIGTGRRKNAVARARLIPGRGRMVINGKTLEDYFPLKRLQMAATAPLRITRTDDRYDVLVTVRGGGISGQAGAVSHGISRALLEVDDEFRRPLKRAGLLTRDPRMVERKKYGLKKARKAPQFSKR